MSPKIARTDKNPSAVVDKLLSEIDKRFKQWSNEVNDAQLKQKKLFKADHCSKLLARNKKQIKNLTEQVSLIVKNRTEISQVKEELNHLNQFIKLLYEDFLENKKSVIESS